MFQLCRGEQRTAKTSLRLRGWLPRRPGNRHQQGADVQPLTNCCQLLDTIDTLVDAVTRVFTTVPHVPPHSGE